MTSLNPPTPVALASMTSTRHLTLGVFRVHPGEVRGEERGFVAAPARISTKTFFVVGIARQQEPLQLFLERGLRW
jgi:hypothetical protein